MLKVVALFGLLTAFLAACTDTTQPEPAAPTTRPAAIPTAKPATNRPPTTEPASATTRTHVRVLSVHDGDTIRVELGGQQYTLRYVGIDAPEVPSAERRGEWLGAEATAKNAELLAGKTVWLEKDVSDTDQYGRLLRFVYAGDLLVNAELVRLGLAEVGYYPPDFGHRDRLLKLQEEAKVARRGLWGPRPTATR